MKISEFIGFLNKKIEKYGDADLIFMVTDYDGSLVSKEFGPGMERIINWSYCPSESYPDTEPGLLQLFLYE